MRRCIKRPASCDCSGRHGSSLGRVGRHVLKPSDFFPKMTTLLQCGVAFEAEHITVRLLRRLTSNQKASLHVGKAKIPTDRLVAGVLPLQSPDGLLITLPWCDVK